MPNAYEPNGNGVHVSVGIGGCVGGGGFVGIITVGVGDKKRVGWIAVGNRVGTKISVGKNPVG